MKKNNVIKILLCLLVLVSLVSPILAQTSKKQIIFAVLNDGRTLEPIVQVEKGQFVELDSNSENGWKDFSKMYYKPKTAYNLIFGGKSSGKVTVVKGPVDGDCSANMAESVTVSAKAKLKGLVMALATDIQTKKTASGLRRTPTLVQRTEIEKVVRAEFTNQKVSAANLKGMRYQNLTAIDFNNVQIFVGSYWLPTTKTERALLFFIAKKDSSGRFDLSHSSFELIKQTDVMSGNIKDVDDGILHELLLDVLDVDGDGIAEIFTIGQAFEGNSFNIYKDQDGKWTKIKEIYNYHCGY